jgi:hypothetical protein
MSAQQALPLPSPAASNTVIINARCSLRIEAAQRFLEAIGPLSDPASFGGSPDDAFDVVVPSLPGFGFSSKPIGKPIGRSTVAPLWNQLMTEVLGYARYGAQGGDMSGATTVLLARQFPASLVGIHMNGVGPGGPLPAEADRTPEERAWVSELNAYLETERDHFNEHQTQASNHRICCRRQSTGHCRLDRRKIERLERFG